eukprot:TRINITY_DN24282_c0_g1_i1.p1 TRINITY_DN24282_c0_g1~~TRINITY_DN24282_c0_g1_i1.p1  ORF type:complete len:199 (-),score=40.25 TRINITY_DN24282_c0_g1_i1:150-746(-)
MNSDYFSIEDFLEHEEKVPVDFVTSIHGLGYLDPGSATADIAEDAHVELPFWLARVLCEKTFAKAQLPLVFSQKNLGNLKAEPMSVSLGSSPFFYDIGQQIALLANDDTRLSLALLHSFDVRMQAVIDQCFNLRNADLTDFSRKLANVEKRMFLAGYNSITEFERWKNHQTGRLTTSTAIQPRRSPRKRPRDSEANFG